MPSKSDAQHNLMEGVAHDPKFAKKVGIPQKVGKEFVKADKHKRGDQRMRNMIRAVFPAQITQLGEREVEVVISTGQRARDGHIIVPTGGDFSNYRANPIVLWQHDVDEPIGNGHDVAIDGELIRARAVFAPAGLSAEADKYCGLVKAGVVRGVSLGIEPIEAEPLDPAKPKGSKRVTKWELLEFSFCSVPVDADALVTARAKTNQTEETGMTTATDPTNTATDRRTLARAKLTRALADKDVDRPVLRRGLYDVANLAYLLESLGYSCGNAAYEAELEGDGSPVPAMIGEAMTKLGEALVAMTDEEVKELLAKHTDYDGGDAEGEDRAYVMAGATPIVRAWRRGFTMLRAGKTISTSNKDKLEGAVGNMARAMKHHTSMGEHHGAVAEGMATCRSLHEDLSESHDEMGDALDGDDGDDKKVERCVGLHRAMGKTIGKMGSAHDDMDDRHQDAGDSHNGIGRSIKSAQKVLRSVVDGSTEGGEDSDSKKVQTSSGTDDSGGSSNSRSMEVGFRRRQADLLALIEVPV